MPGEADLPVDSSSRMILQLICGASSSLRQRTGVCKITMKTLGFHGVREFETYMIEFETIDFPIIEFETFELSLGLVWVEFETRMGAG